MAATELKLLRRNTDDMKDTNLQDSLEEFYAKPFNYPKFDFADSIPLDCNFLDLEDRDKLIADPDKFIYNAERALYALVPPDINTFSPDEKSRKHYRVRPIHVHNRKSLRWVNSGDVETMVSLVVNIRKVKQIHNKLAVGHYKCGRCGYEFQAASDLMSIDEPLTCMNESCLKDSKQTVLYLDTKKSIFIDAEECGIEERREERQGPDAYRLPLLVTGDLCQKLKPGMNCVVNGIVRPLKMKSAGVLDSNKFMIYIEAVSFEDVDADMEIIKITEDDKKEIKELSKNKDILGKLVKCIAPGIFNLDEIKLAIVLSLFGGVDKTMNDESIKGRINILMCGDPACGKSQILQAAYNLAPRAEFVAGGATSAVGLIACAVRDEDDGEWGLEPGSLVLADGGHCFIDEFEKNKKDDIRAMHTVMEQGLIHYSKANIHVTLPARTAIIAAANPKDGRFDPDEVISEQMDLDPTVLSRFDLVFILMDEVNKEKDTDLSRLIIDHHVETTRLMRGGKKEAEPEVSRELFQKYVLFARQSIIPILSKKAQERIQECYVETRISCKQNGVDNKVKRRISISTRQLEALIRLTEAVARARLKDEADETDADVAIKIFTYSMDKIAKDKDGNMDIDRVMSGHDRGRENKFERIVDIIHTLESDAAYSEGVPEAMIAKAIHEKYPNAVSAFELPQLLDKMTDMNPQLIVAPRHYRCYRTV
jgi:replicative DNA helicase Mcm